MKRAAFILILFLASAEISAAHAGEERSSGIRPAGLFFAGTYWPVALFSTGHAGFAGDAGAAVGYELDSGIAPWVAFLTGSHRIPEGAGVNHLAYGGFVLGLNYHFRPYLRAHSLLSIAFRTGTLLDESGAGYNQEGFRIAAGESFAFSRYFAFTAQVTYGWDYQTRWIGAAQSLSSGAPQSVASAGLMFMFAFYPHIYP